MSAIAMVAVAALLFAACGGDDSSSDDGNGNGGSMPEGEPIILGMDEDQTSAGAAFSMVTGAAVRDVIAKVNDEGGILGRPVELVVGNSESDPTKGPAVVRSLVEDGAQGIFLTAGSGASIQMKPTIQDSQVVSIAPTAVGAALTDQPDADFVYTMGNSAASWGPIYCDAFEAAGVETVGVMTENTPQLAATNEGLIDNGISECVDIVATEMAAPDSADVTAQISRISDADPDAVLVSTSGGPFEILSWNTISQVMDPDVLRFTVFSLVNQPEEWQLANPGALEGVISLSAIDPTNPRTEEVQEFFNEFRGEEIFLSSYEAQAYDSVYLMKRAMEEAGDPDNGEAVMEAMNAITDYKPHYGQTDFTLSFSADKHNAPDGECGLLFIEFGADNDIVGPWETYLPEC